MSTAVLAVCPRCDLPLTYRCTERVARAGSHEELDVFECMACGRVATCITNTKQPKP